MNKYKRITVTIFLAAVASSVAMKSGNAGISDPQDTNPSCDRIRRNTSLSIVVQSSAVQITLLNRDRDPLWVPQDENPAFGVNSDDKRSTIPYGYFKRYAHREGYSIPPMEKVAPKQTFRWVNQDPTVLANAIGPGYAVKLLVRVALQAFPQSQSQAEAQRDLPTYLSQSCILESSTTVKSPISVGLGHLPLKGDPRAKLNIVEFADFQCSFCKRFFTDIEPKIIKDYVSTGKANFYFRHLPFLGTESTSAAEAAECANEQKKFWAFHDYLFSHQANENSGTFSIKNLEGFAAGMGLDAAKFKTCLETGKYAKQIAGDSADGKKAGLNGAPATFINGANGSLIFGSPAYSDFQKAIEAALKQ